MTHGWLRAATVCAGALLALAAGTGVARADVVFDPADADELAATLAEAAEGQGVCYGWNVQVDDPDNGTSRSVGSNFGAGSPVGDHGPSCLYTVEFVANITYTSEWSESDDFATFGVVSYPSGPSTDDLDALHIVDEGGLVGDDVDVVVGKAVAALPQLAADAGLARPIEAAPETGAPDPRAHLTDSPGSDFWRQSGGMLLWGAGLLLAGAVFGAHVVHGARNPAVPGRKPALHGGRPSTRAGSARSRGRASRHRKRRRVRRGRGH